MHQMIWLLGARNLTNETQTSSKWYSVLRGTFVSFAKALLLRRWQRHSAKLRESAESSNRPHAQVVRRADRLPHHANWKAQQQAAIVPYATKIEIK